MDKLQAFFEELLAEKRTGTVNVGKVMSDIHFVAVAHRVTLGEIPAPNIGNSHWIRRKAYVRGHQNQQRHHS